MTLIPSIVIHDSGFVFNPETGDSFTVNIVGLEIITLLKGGSSREDVYKYLSKTFNRKASLLYKDVEGFFWELQHHKLLKDE